MGLVSVWTAVVALLSFVGGVVFALAILVWLPVDFFTATKRPHVSLPWRIVKNVVGVVLIVLGLIMLITPEQGLLTLVIGLALVDFPGRHEFIRRFVARPNFLAKANHWRARFGRPPLEAP
jgi:hypothetical protein